MAKLLFEKKNVSFSSQLNDLATENFKKSCKKRMDRLRALNINHIGKYDI